MSECRYPCDCDQFDDEHCSCMEGHAAPEPADQTRADVVLTEAERETLDSGIREWEDRGGPLMNALVPAVERLLAARAAEHAAEGERWQSRCEQHERRRAEIEQILDVALGTEEEDGAGEGLVADVALLAARAEAAEATVARVRALLPDECWVSRSVEVRCTDYVGGDFSNGAKFTEGMCCLPCRVRAALDGERL